MSSEFSPIFAALRSILHQHAPSYTVTADTPNRYSLEGPVGPATLASWGGEARTKMIPIAWIEIGKAYVSYHLMALGNPKLHEGMSKELKARMQGKTCLNFKKIDEPLFKELDQLTAKCIAGFKKAGFIL